MNKRRFNWMTTGTTTVCILAVLFTVFSIFSTSKITKQTNEMYEHPYQVKAAAEAMRTRLAEIEYYLPTLLVSDYNHSYEIKQLLLERDKRQLKSLEIISERYNGPEEQLEYLKTAFSEVSQARLRAVDHFLYGGTDDEITNYLEKEVEPYNLALHDALDWMSNYADQQVEDIWNGTVKDQKTAISGAVLLCFLIIGMAVYSNWNERRKNKEITYREQLFNLLSNSIDDVFFIYNCSKHNMEFISGNSERILGIKQDEFYADPLALRNYLSEDTKEAFDSVFQNKPILNNTQCDIKFIKGGDIRNFQMQIYAIYSKNKLQRYIVLLSDLTEIMAHQNVLNDALLSAQKANTAKREFLSRMSHEIRTPMNTIIGMTAIAMRHMDDRNYIENSLAKITYSSGHLLSLINDILDMSKIEDNKLTINYDVFDFHKLIESITEVVYPQTVDRKQKFEVVVDGQIDQMLIGDAMRVNQILFNLLSNAVKFTPEDGEVRLEISKFKEKDNRVFLRFIVRDTGIGMSEEYLKRLYMPFEQADSSIAQKYGGSGLGMSITNNLVSLLNGTITVKSKEGKGTTFTVELPFGMTVQKAIASKGELDKIKVLVVDDDENTCEHAVILMENMGIKSRWVNNGREAIEIVIQAHEQGDDFDVCLIDWCMPDMDGVETARNIRKRLGPDTLIIIISAYDWSVIEKEAREAGVNAFISKPMFASSIINAINSVIKPKYGSTAEMKKNQEYNFQGRKVLLAEDNMINQEIVVELLKDIGIVVECADNGKLALEMYEKSKPDEYAMILMDVQMPIMNGYESTRAIRASKHPQAATVPILAMTANAFNEDVAASKEAGMDNHLSKPIDVDMLYKTMADYLNP